MVADPRDPAVDNVEKGADPKPIALTVRGRKIAVGQEIFALQLEFGRRALPSDELRKTGSITCSR